MELEARQEDAMVEFERLVDSGKSAKESYVAITSAFGDVGIKNYQVAQAKLAVIRRARAIGTLGLVKVEAIRNAAKKYWKSGNYNIDTLHDELSGMFDEKEVRMVYPTRFSYTSVSRSCNADKRDRARKRMANNKKLTMKSVTKRDKKEIVTRAKQLRDSGWTYSAIAKELNKEFKDTGVTVSGGGIRHFIKEDHQKERPKEAVNASKITSFVKVKILSIDGNGSDVTLTISRDRAKQLIYETVGV